MSEVRRKFDEDFKIGAVRIVRETGKPIAQVARDLGINEGTLANWCAKDRRARGEGSGALSEDERAELERLRREMRDRCGPLPQAVESLLLFAGLRLRLEALGVQQADLAGVGDEGRLQDVRALEIAPGGGVRDRGGKLKAPAPSRIQQAGEHARRVEVRQAHPVDGAIRGDERCGEPVADQAPCGEGHRPERTRVAEHERMAHVPGRVDEIHGTRT